MSTYETDFYHWTQETAELLKQGKFSEIDLNALIEEVESIGRSEKSEIREKLGVLLTYLLKWQYQPDKKVYDWQNTISFQRTSIELSIEDSPSLSNYITDEVVNSAYEIATIRAALEMDVDEEVYPATFDKTGWSLEQVLDIGFYPGGGRYA